MLIYLMPLRLSSQLFLAKGPRKEEKVFSCRVLHVFTHSFHLMLAEHCVKYIVAGKVGTKKT